MKPYRKIVQYRNQMKILQSLQEKPQLRITLETNTGLSHPTISKHVKILLSTGLVKEDRYQRLCITPKGLERLETWEIPEKTEQITEKTEQLTEKLEELTKKEGD